MLRQPASKGSGTNSPRDVEGAINLDLRPLLGVNEVAYLLGVPRATLYRWQSLSSPGAPQGPRAFRVGRYLRYTLDDVQSYIDQLQHSASLLPDAPRLR